LLPAPPPTSSYTLSLHDALPISATREEPAGRAAEGHRQEQHFRQGEDGQYLALQKSRRGRRRPARHLRNPQVAELRHRQPDAERSEEHTSELQSPYDLVCRLLLE